MEGNEQARIKFRVWDKGRQHMSGVALISFGDDGSARTIIAQPAPKPKYIHDLVEGENGVLMQWTGLHDKNGKEIYAGDVIVQQDYPFYDNGVLSYVAVVEWTFAGYEAILHCVNPNKRGASHGINESLEDDETWEVLGNIYEHPDLLVRKERP